LSSAASAGNAAIENMREWSIGTNGKWTSMGVYSNGEYGIEKNLMYSFPVVVEN
jgi:malate dehydrogenase